MVTFTFRCEGREEREEFESLSDCCHSAALRRCEGAGQPVAIEADGERRWEGEELRELLDGTERRHGWTAAGGSPRRG